MPIVLVELDVAELLLLLLLPDKAKAAPAPAAATAVQMSHFFRLEWFEYPSGELEMETDESELDRSEFDAIEPGFEKFEMETEGRSAGTMAATSGAATGAGAFGWSVAAGTSWRRNGGGSYRDGGLAVASSATNGRGGAWHGASDNLFFEKQARMGITLGRGDAHGHRTGTSDPVDPIDMRNSRGVCIRYGRVSAVGKCSR